MSTSVTSGEISPPAGVPVLLSASPRVLVAGGGGSGKDGAKAEMAIRVALPTGATVGETSRASLMGCSAGCPHDPGTDWNSP